MAPSVGVWKRQDLIADHEYTAVEFYKLSPAIWTRLIDWCRDSYGEPTPKRWFVLYRRIYFYDSADHLMFILTWDENAISALSDTV
jgi:hypothetical protein